MLTTNYTSAPPDIYSLRASTPERLLLVVWSVLILIICLPGNALILVASIQHQAIKLDNISVILIRNIAAADVIYAVFVALSSITSMVADTWVLGQFLCNLTPAAMYVSALASTEMICALNICKLTWLLSPLRSRTRTKRAGHILASALWFWSCFVFASTAIGFFLNTGSWQYRYRPSVLRCDFTFATSVENHPAGNTVSVLTIIFLLTPILVIMTTTVILACFLKKVNRMNRNSLLTLLLISSVFCVSWLPVTVYNFIMATASNLEYKVYADYLVYLYRFSVFVIYLNIAANPLIYMATIPSFRKFVKSLLNRYTRARVGVFVPPIIVAKSETEATSVQR